MFNKKLESSPSYNSCVAIFFLLANFKVNSQNFFTKKPHDKKLNLTRSMLRKISFVRYENEGPCVTG